uniref:Calponin-homology (CH) domain-containing protein n=1 Tax=Neolamprologus brichardi TaxID=32507 RepID=A0A3Q4MFT3_NEOBR
HVNMCFDRLELILELVSCRITDLYMDLRDGRMLIKLLEVLSGERLAGVHSLTCVSWRLRDVTAS